MKLHNTPTVYLTLLAALLLSSCASPKETTKPNLSDQQRDAISEIITKMPAADQDEGQWFNSRLLDMGPAGIHALVGMLQPPGSGNDTYARYALNGLAKYVSRPGAESDRNSYERVLIDELASSHPPSVKGFLTEQLELIGSNLSVPVLQSFLNDERLYDPAVQALTSIGTPAAGQVLRQALSQAEGKRQVSLLKAIGDLKITSAAQELLPYASSRQWPNQNAALYALAQTGNPAAEQPLSNAADSATSFRKTAIRAHYILFLNRLAEEGHQPLSSEISREILQQDYPVHFKTSALTVLIQNEQAGAMDQLTAAAESPDAELRSVALSLAGTLPEGEVTNALATRLRQNSPEVQADIIAALGKMGDKAALSSIVPYLNDNNPQVKNAAAQAVTTLGGVETLRALLVSLGKTQDPDGITAIKSALLQMPTDKLLPAVAEALSTLSGDAKIASIEILAERQGTDYLEEVLSQRFNSSDSVRLAVFRAMDGVGDTSDLARMIALLPEARNPEEREAIQESIVAVATNLPASANRAEQVVRALNQAPDSEKPALLEMLPDIGGEGALDAIVARSKSTNSEVQAAALSALSRWPDASAITPLLEAFRAASGENRGELLAAYIRVVQESKYASRDKVRFFRDAITEDATTAQKIRILKTLSEIDDPAALALTGRYYKDANPEVREQALRTAAAILAPAYDRTRPFDGADKALSALESTTDAEIRRKIEQYIKDWQMQQQTAQEFNSLFNGRDLSGWTGDTDAYTVKDGQLIHRPGERGNLFTEEQYGDFILRFDFKLTPGANNGLAIRSPLEGNPAYAGMELQIIDNKAEKYSELQPYQYHGSVYGVVPAERGYLKPAGEWNTQEVIARGSQITVILNGEIILDADLREAGTPQTIDGRDHPGLMRSRGHVGFLGHGDEVAFRNIRIRDLNAYTLSYSTGPDGGGDLNRPPEGFRTLFNGENLEGWNGLVGNPETRAKMSPEELEEAQKEANLAMRRHWSVHNGILYFDGEGESLTTEKEFKDFEMLVDWKIEPHGDSGVYLRGTPQVQIWDITENPQGSGGLYNNQNHRSTPLVPADNAIGEWNSMRIKMIGERVTVHLNGQLVVPDVVLENYWDRDKSIYPKGQIELQAHNTPLYFRNIFIREIPRTENLINANDRSNWVPVGNNADTWQVEDGTLYTEGIGGGWISTDRMYDNFKLELEYRLPEGGNSGVFIRAPRGNNPSHQGIEIQLLDDYAEQYANLQPWQYTGSLYDVKAPSARVSMKAGQWQRMQITADGPNIKVILNGQIINNANLVNHMNRVEDHPGLKRRSGYVGLQNHSTKVEFRNIRITEIK